MPQQVPRLAIVFGLMLAALIVARQTLIPPTFGQTGHYRAAAADSIAARPIKYAGRQACEPCHEEEAAARLAGNHRGVGCETCHGPSAAHVDSALDVKPGGGIPDTREFCVTCHAYNASRPTGFPQIDAIRHNFPQACKNCHNPHAPVPPKTPGECSACHNQIAQQKTLSHHAELSCTECHVAPDEHKDAPRSVRPTKPRTREECGKCHTSGARDGPPQVDLPTHGVPYLCWDCHYPHFPESR
jgi:hypothetical protein